MRGNVHASVYAEQESVRYELTRPTGSWEVVMPVLTNERHELFCKGAAGRRSQTQAYITGGYFLMQR